MLKALLLAMPNIFYGAEFLGRVPNHGLVSLAGNVDPGLCQVRVADLVLVRKGIGEFVRRLVRSYAPDLVGFSCMSFQYTTALKLAELVKVESPQTPTLFGGYHPTLMYEEIAQDPDAAHIDFIIRGEGEATFAELVRALSGGMDLGEVPGLSFKQDGSFHHNPPRELLSLSEMRHPRREARLLGKGFHGFGLPIDTVETSRGCLHNCNFCSITQMYGRSFRKYPLEWVVEDVRQATSFGARSIFFVDDNITLDLNHFEALCDALISHRLNHLHYIVQASVRGISSSARLVRKMAQAGFKIVFLGIENVSTANLSFFSKDYREQEMVRAAVGYLRENGIISLGGFIVGNPEDGAEDLWANFHYARELELDAPSFFIATPYPKTRLRAELLKRGLVTNPDEFSTYNGSRANVRTEFLSPVEIEFTVWQMYNRYHDLHYLRFNRIKRVYPFYFLKLVLGSLPRALGHRLARWLRLRDEADFYRAAKRREVKRRRRWLLEGLGGRMQVPEKGVELCG